MNENRCICCNKIIPEGRQVCWSCENGNMQYDEPESPSEEQIRLVDMIVETLNIDFPQSSENFTAKIYEEFINSYINAARKYCRGLK